MKNLNRQLKAQVKMKKPKKELTVDQKIKRRNFISFAIFGAYAAGAYGGWRWLYKSPDETAGITAGAHKPLRRALNKTELFFRRLAFNENHLVKTYPKAMAAKNVITFFMTNCLFFDFLIIVFDLLHKTITQKIFTKQGC